MNIMHDTKNMIWYDMVFTCMECNKIERIIYTHQSVRILYKMHSIYFSKYLYTVYTYISHTFACDLQVVAVWCGFQRNTPDMSSKIPSKKLESRDSPSFTM